MTTTLNTSCSENSMILSARRGFLHACIFQYQSLNRSQNTKCQYTSGNFVKDRPHIQQLLDFFGSSLHFLDQNVRNQLCTTRMQCVRKASRCVARIRSLVLGLLAIAAMCTSIIFLPKIWFTINSSQGFICNCPLRCVFRSFVSIFVGNNSALV